MGGNNDSINDGRRIENSEQTENTSNKERQKTSFPK